MTDINTLLISLLRFELRQLDPHDFLTTADTDFRNPEVLAPLCRLAAVHDLTHIVGAALYRMGLPCDNPYAAVIKKAQINAIIRYEQLQYELQQISALFDSIHIRHIPLKGSVIRTFYPQPEMRTSCDIDMLIEPKNLDSAANALVETLGYQKGKAGSHDIAFFAPSGIHLELHFTLIEEGSYPQIQDFLSRVWDYALPTKEGEFSYQLRQEFFYFYHIVHMVKHFEYGGCGVRTLMDLWILEHRGPEFNRVELDHMLKESGILTFTEQVRTLAEVWFSDAVPDSKSQRLIQSMQEYLLSGGIYGSTENRVKVGRLKNIGKLNYICSRLFLPYNNLKYQYPILQKHRSLLPFFEIHRWFRLLSGDTAQRITQELKINDALTHESQFDIHEMFRQLGLK